MRSNPECPKCKKGLLSVCYRKSRAEKCVPKTLRNLYYCDKCDLIITAEIEYKEVKFTNLKKEQTSGKPAK